MKSVLWYEEASKGSNMNMDGHLTNMLGAGDVPPAKRSKLDSTTSETSGTFGKKWVWLRAGLRM